MFMYNVTFNFATTLNFSSVHHVMFMYNDPFNFATTLNFSLVHHVIFMYNVTFNIATTLNFSLVHHVMFMYNEPKRLIKNSAREMPVIAHQMKFMVVPYTGGGGPLPPPNIYPAFV